jgi:hypothetical protein
VLRGTMILQPAFQRAYVWDRRKASRLIESLVLQIPIPVLYVAQETPSTYAVVDGQQRLTGIVAYITGTFPDGKAFRLAGLSVLPELRVKLFKELPQACQDAILTAILRVIIITQDSDPEVKFEMFERLNLGAVQLTDQELRNSMYHGAYNALLHELAAHPTLLKIRGDAPPAQADGRLSVDSALLRDVAPDAGEIQSPHEAVSQSRHGRPPSPESRGPCGHARRV